jgi:hypothetical protein
VVAELRLADDEDDDEGACEDDEDGEKEYPLFCASMGERNCVRAVAIVGELAAKWMRRGKGL